MTRPKSTVRSSVLWQRTFIITGWAIYILLVGAAFLAATGVTAPDAGANPWWIIPVKSLIWPAAGHAIAGYIEHRTQRNLQAGLVWISRSQPAFPKTSN